MKVIPLKKYLIRILNERCYLITRCVYIRVRVRESTRVRMRALEYVCVRVWLRESVSERARTGVRGVGDGQQARGGRAGREQPAQQTRRARAPRRPRARQHAAHARHLARLRAVAAQHSAHTLLLVRASYTALLALLL